MFADRTDWHEDELLESNEVSKDEKVDVSIEGIEVMLEAVAKNFVEKSAKPKKKKRFCSLRLPKGAE